MITPLPPSMQAPRYPREALRGATYRWAVLAAIAVIVLALLYLPVDWLRLHLGPHPPAELQRRSDPFVPAFRVIELGLDRPAPNKAPREAPAQRTVPRRNVRVAPPESAEKSSPGQSWSWDPTTPYTVRDELMGWSQPDSETVRQQMLKELSRHLAMGPLTGEAVIDTNLVRQVQRHFTELNEWLLQRHLPRWQQEMRRRFYEDLRRRLPERSPWD